MSTVHYSPRYVYSPCDMCYVSHHAMSHVEYSDSQRTCRIVIIGCVILLHKTFLHTLRENEGRSQDSESTSGQCYCSSRASGQCKHEAFAACILSRKGIISRDEALVYESKTKKWPHYSNRRYSSGWESKTGNPRLGIHHQ